ncbi:hypothetical protein [Tardiphaga sp.]|uniref:hypothetical protein n=1 Tax=Tardiphaga sp. TaxID=1926292 RepID=UPI00261D6CCD|nr:hypothetical protein [Tardiphaga sp.]MDB5616194.1 hypothetical protein [Tardiphaga sp.]
MLPTRDQQLAIQARLNMLLGAEIYDALFLGFECGVIFEDIAHVSVPTEDAAAAIDVQYPWQVAIAVESIIKLPIKSVHILPRNYPNV